MGRTAENQLHDRPLANGSVLLFGRVLGERVRKRFKSYAELAIARAGYQQRILERAKATDSAPTLKLTRLTNEQLRDAEAAVELAHGRRLTECVVAAQKVLPPVGAITCDHALNTWLDTLLARKRSPRTIDKNKRRVEDFIEFAKVKFLEDVRPETIERYVYRTGAADYTRVTDAQVIQAWLRFCCARARRWLAITPFEIDMKDLSATARPTEPGRILTPEQCKALLTASATIANGRLLPYCILTTWLFMRDSEAKRTPRAKMFLDAATPVVECDPTKRRTVRYRKIAVPTNVLAALRAAVADWKPETTVPFSRSQWDRVREAAGLLTRAKTSRGKRRKHLESQWQGDITRHTGISYLYQQSEDIKDVCRQAGNKTDVSFRHYLTLPSEGAAAKFYAITLKEKPAPGKS